MPNNIAQKIMKKIVLFFLIGIVILTLSSCVSIANRSKQTISFESTPSGADVKVGGRVICRTPCRAPIQRARQTTVTFSRINYENRDVVLKGDFTAGFWSVFGGATTGVTTGALVGLAGPRDEWGFLDPSHYGRTVLNSTIVGGVMGFVIDLSTGALWRYNTTRISATLTPDEAELERRRIEADRRVEEINRQREETRRQQEETRRELEETRRRDEEQRRRREFQNKRADGRSILTLTRVERPTNPQIRFGRTTTEETGETQTVFNYVDNFINIIWIPTSTDFRFNLTNNSPHSMRVIWDEAVYVDENGMVSKMIHEGTRLVDINNPQAPAVVPRGASLSSFLAPVSRISRGRMSPLFDGTGARLENQTVRISLPLQIQNVINEYVFTFRINWRYTHPELQNMTFEEYMERQ
jgi:hypothetical protein